MDSPEPRHCRDCMYDLTGVEAVREVSDDAYLGDDEPDFDDGELVWRCPECGRPFDPDDPSTTRPGPKPLLRRAAESKLVRSGALLAVLLTLFWLTILPRPSTKDWTQWTWLGRIYGTTTEWTSLGRVHRSIWADRLVGVRAEGWRGSEPIEAKLIADDRLRVTVGAEGVEWRAVAWLIAQFDLESEAIRFGSDKAGETSAAFSVEGPAEKATWTALSMCGVSPDFVLRRVEPEVWRLEVSDPGVGWGPIVASFNSLRDNRFGVRINGAAARSPDSVEPFAVEGNEADVLWRVVNAYGLEIDLPERVPARSDGWHPTRPSRVAPRPAPDPRGGVAPARVSAFR